MIRYLKTEPNHRDIPEFFQNPMNDDIHPLAMQASKMLQALLPKEEDQKGVMLGVIVVIDHAGKIGYLSGYSGKEINIESDISFVPALNDSYQHNQTVLINSAGIEKPILSFFDKTEKLSNIGDCVTTKLIQYAIVKKFKLVASAEFWWGKPPKEKIRQHGYYYAACRGKCQPILPFLLDGLLVQPYKILGLYTGDNQAPKLLYEDDELMVVNKPAGLLSVPGKTVRDSVITRLQSRYPLLKHLVLLHRLDMATSGILLLAKTVKANRILQKQFINRTIEKRYIAVLSHNINLGSSSNNSQAGIIELPLRVDFEDRPRQMMCHKYGKNAITRWKIVSNKEAAEHDANRRIYFYPLTGRTHQLRVHAAHKDGLNSPIVGDPLYGKKDQRLKLHAERIRFSHPVTGKRIEVQSPATF